MNVTAGQWRDAGLTAIAVIESGIRRGPDMREEIAALVDDGDVDTGALIGALAATAAAAVQVLAGQLGVEPGVVLAGLRAEVLKEES